MGKSWYGIEEWYGLPPMKTQRLLYCDQKENFGGEQPPHSEVLIVYEDGGRVFVSQDTEEPASWNPREVSWAEAQELVAAMQAKIGRKVFDNGKYVPERPVVLRPAAAVAIE